MDVLTALVTVLYYLFVAVAAAALAANFLKERNWQREVLFAVVLIPFLLRLFRLK